LVERSASFQKPIKTKKNQQKPRVSTNKNLFFLVRIGFYWFLNDAERYSSIYVDDLSYKGFGGTIADNHYKHSLSDKKKWVSETCFLSPDDRLKFSRKFHRIVGRYFCHAKKGRNNARG